MKKIFIAIIICSISFTLMGCNHMPKKNSVSKVIEEQKNKDLGRKNKNNDRKKNAETYSKNTSQNIKKLSKKSKKTKKHNLDTLDLRKLETTILFAQMADININPNDYKDKNIIINGIYNHSFDNLHNKHHYGIITKDIQGCCVQGLEFIPTTSAEKEFLKMEDMSVVTIEGVVHVIKENGFSRAILKECKILKE